MFFDWDVDKANANIKKHGISFEEAVTIFDDILAATFNDPDHSVGEYRFLTFGTTATGKQVVVAHTDFADVVRLISCRYMTKHERFKYEEGK